MKTRTSAPTSVATSPSASFKRVALSFAFLYGVLSPDVGRAEPEFWQTDKIEHASVSAALSSASYVFVRRQGFTRWEAFATSLGLSLIVGVGKEVFDPKVDTDDIRADLAGGAAGSVFSFSVDVVAF